MNVYIHTNKYTRWMIDDKDTKNGFSFYSYSKIYANDIIHYLLIDNIDKIWQGVIKAPKTKLSIKMVFLYW